MLADTHDYAPWTTRTVELDSLIKQDAPAAEHFAADELRRRQFAVGWSIEDLEMILHPMVEDGKEAVGSMGDDAPLAVLRDTYRGMHHYFRQNFSQVTNPPIDSLARAQRDDDPDAARQSRQHPRREPRAERDAVAAVADRAQRRVRGDAQVHGRDRLPHRLHLRCPKGGLDAMRQAFDRICKEAEDGVRSGCLHVVLTDANVDADRAALPDDHGGGRRALLPGAPVAAHLHLAQRALGASASTCTMPPSSSASAPPR